MYKEKLCHGKYDATAFPCIGECTECGKSDVKIMVFTAENSAGEWYTVDICECCLKESLVTLERYEGNDDKLT